MQTPKEATEEEVEVLHQRVVEESFNCAVAPAQGDEVAIKRPHQHLRRDNKPNLPLKIVLDPPSPNHLNTINKTRLTTLVILQMTNQPNQIKGIHCLKCFSHPNRPNNHKQISKRKLHLHLQYQHHHRADKIRVLIMKEPTMPVGDIVVALATEEDLEEGEEAAAVVVGMARIREHRVRVLSHLNYLYVLPVYIYHSMYSSLIFA